MVLKKRFQKSVTKNKKNSLSTAHELWYHAVIQLSGLFCSRILTHFMRKRETVQANLRCIYKSSLPLVLRVGEEGRASQLVAWPWDALQEGQGLDSLFSDHPPPTFGL